MRCINQSATLQLFVFRFAFLCTKQASESFSLCMSAFKLNTVPADVFLIIISTDSSFVPFNALSMETRATVKSYPTHFVCINANHPQTWTASRHESTWIMCSKSQSKQQFHQIGVISDSEYHPLSRRIGSALFVMRLFGPLFVYIMLWKRECSAAALVNDVQECTCYLHILH